MFIQVWTVFLYFVIVTTSESPCPEVLTEDITNGIRLPNGSIYWNNVTFDKNKYFTTSHGNVTVRRGCICEYKACYRKCCPPGQIFGLDNTCQNSILSKHYHVSIYDFDGNVSSKFIHEIHNNVCEHGGIKIEPDDPEDYHRVQEDGTLFFVLDEISLDSHEYCMEVFEIDNMTTAVTCLTKDERTEDDEIDLIPALGIYKIHW